MIDGRISVIMPAFDAERTVAAALASVRAQRRPADEIIVVDDGSRDGTPAILASLAGADPRLRVIRQANAGPMAARNRAIGESRGGFIAPLDADDLWHPDYLADLAEAMERSDPPAGFAYALFRVIDGDSRIVRDGADYGVAGQARWRHLLVNFVGSGSNAVFRRAALERAGGYDERTRGWGGAEDYLLQLRIARHWPVARVGRRLVGYRHTPGSYSADAAAARRARTLAVGQAIAEGGAPPLPVRRWVEADAARTLAAELLRGRRVVPALLWGLQALARDPVATTADLGRRLANIRRRRRPAAPERFAGTSPDRDDAPPPDPVTRRRLARLAELE